MSRANSFVTTHHAPEGVTCLCGDIECSGLTNTFKVLKDTRKRFVKLPKEFSQRRESYLRYLLPEHPVEQQISSNYIAVHHFHPAVLNRQQHGIPKTISLGTAVQLRMILDHRDKVTDESGMPAFVFVPNYTKEQVKHDVIDLAREKRKERKTANHKTAVESKEEKSQASSVEIPTLVVVDDDEESDVSSIHHEEDGDKLVTLVSAAITLATT